MKHNQTRHSDALVSASLRQGRRCAQRYIAIFFEEMVIETFEQRFASS